MRGRWPPHGWNKCFEHLSIVNNKSYAVTRAENKQYNPFVMSVGLGLNLAPSACEGLVCSLPKTIVPFSRILVWDIFLSLPNTNYGICPFKPNLPISYAYVSHSRNVLKNNYPI